MPSGDNDITPAATPTMISAQQISQVDNVRFLVEVEWDDNENRDDELVTIFKFSPPGGSGSVYVDSEGTGYTAAGTGRCKGTVIMSAGEFEVTAQCSRHVTLTDVEGAPAKVSISSDWSNGVPCSVGKPGNGKGHGKGGNPNK